MSGLLRPGSGKLAPRAHLHLTRGLDKLGRRIFAWSLPAVLSCPGATETCLSVCYATRNRWNFANVKDRLALNWELSRSPFFAETLIREIWDRRIGVVRIHSSGDFDTDGYVRKWGRIVRNCPSTTFYFYTRSWRLAGLREVIEEELLDQENVFAWYSCDQSSGIPNDLPVGVQVAWLMVEEGEPIPTGVDLIFRSRRLRHRPAKRIALALVCPTENGTEGASQVSCSTCRHCFS